MRVLHVVTLISDDGAYGGPLRVALNQVAELRRRGHDALLAAGWRGTGRPPAEVDGVPVHAFGVHAVVPGAGFSGLHSPGLVRWTGAALRGADVVHVHAARDLVTTSALRASARAGVPAVVQTHGMVRVDHRVRARVFDALLTRRLLGGAEVLLTLTDEEERALPEVLRRRPALHRVANGVPLPAAAVPAVAGRAGGGGDEVLFCARLHPRKRPTAFVEMAALVARSLPGARFAVVGPDEGELAAVERSTERLGLAGKLRYEGALPYGQVPARLAAARVHVLPSVDEPFPMGLLEAMGLGVPSVCTDSCGISGVLAERGAAVVTDGSPQALAAAVERLLTDPAHHAEVARRGREAVREVFSIEAVVDDLERVYAGATRAATG